MHVGIHYSLLLDHELSAQMIDNVSAHFGSCSECDAALLKAKEEAALVELRTARSFAQRESCGSS